MRKIAFMICIVCCVACNDDADIHNDSVVDVPLLFGEWVSPNASNEYYSYLKISDSQAAEFSIVQNQLGDNSVYAEDKGSWHLYDKQSIAIMMLYYNDLNFDIVELNSDYMRLRNVKYNTLDTFYHVVETIEIGAGQEAEIQFLKSSGGSAFISFESSNEDIVTVSGDGVIASHQGGVAFVSMYSVDKTLYVKVVVKSRVDMFAEETHNTIDEIIQKHGEPDLSAQLTDQMSAIAYNTSLKDLGLKIAQYNYDIKTKEIIRILTVYNSEEGHDRDWEYLSDFYYKLPHKLDFYGKHEDYWDNSYIITPFYSDGLPYINYINQDYNTYDE